MTEYKMGLLSFFNHLPVLLLEGIMIYGATFIEFQQWIWLMITFVIFAATVITITIDSNKIFGISKQTFQVRIGNKKREYLLTSIKTIKVRKRHIEIGFKDSGKVKTIYIGWYVRRFKKLKAQLFEYLEQLDHYDRIIFID